MCNRLTLTQTLTVMTSYLYTVFRKKVVRLFFKTYLQLLAQFFQCNIAEQ